jgi:hypothetical protein
VYAQGAVQCGNSAYDVLSDPEGVAAAVGGPEPECRFWQQVWAFFEQSMKEAVFKKLLFRAVNGDWAIARSVVHRVLAFPNHDL